MKNKLIALICLSTFAFANDGTINIKSQYSVDVTVEKFTSILKQKGMNIFDIIEHSKGAKNVGIDLRDTSLVIFGNPKVGSPLMKCQQKIALDLPQKALVWRDAENQTWISYNDPKYLKSRHNVEDCDKVFDKISMALKKLTSAAVK